MNFRGVGIAFGVIFSLFIVGRVMFLPVGIGKLWVTSPGMASGVWDFAVQHYTIQSYLQEVLLTDIQVYYSTMEILIHYVIVSVPFGIVSFVHGWKTK